VRIAPVAVCVAVASLLAVVADACSIYDASLLLPAAKDGRDNAGGAASP
jgi:hypothetical protein